MTSVESVEELVFLRQMVQRLNSALAKHVGTREGDHMLEGDVVNPPAPWLTDPRVLSPLLDEYDEHLTHLVSEITKLNEENQERKIQFQTVTEENERLRYELKEILQQQINEAGSTDIPQGRENEMLENLQCQLELANKEKDEAVKMCRDTIQQLDKLRHQRQSESASVKTKLQSYEETRALNEQLQDSNLNMQMMIETLKNENQALSSALQQQETDLQTTRDQLKELKHESQRTKIEYDETTKMLTNAQRQMQSMEDELNDYRQRQLMNENKTEQLRSALTEAESKLAQALQKHTDSESRIDNFKIEAAALEKTIRELEQKELDAMMQLRENGQLMENALLARDSALVREKQKQDELDKMKETMETLIEEAANRVKTEVDKVKRQSNANIQRMMDDIQSLELEINNLRSEVDRAKRAKRAVEDEMVQMERKQKDEQSDRRTQEMQTRMLIAERAKDDALINVQSLEDKIKRIRIEHDSSITSLIAKHESLEQNEKLLKHVIDECQHERILLLETVNRYKNESQKFESIANDVRLETSKETARIKSKLEREKKQLKVRITSLEDSNRNGIQNLHKMLADQQRMTAKWKEECMSINSKYEAKMSELKSQLTRTKRRCTDLTNKLQQLNQQRSEISEQVPELNETNRQLRARLHETEYRLITATEKLGQMQGRKTALTLRDLD